ncbi:MAG: UDP-N-acetylmuramoyl-tripeptide--D-alanyl-D-alanine ligase [Bifidobacteriaceae bacterium]|nr:UDP-N-acetylmuramoyl-tripeptide--D-alanyl-D-alanine ligase [Bifidobacteriaceae bacterium]
MRVITNSKLIKAGDTFVALGKGVDFIGEAKLRGASKIIKGETAFGIESKKYLANLRRHNPNLKVIAITGSVGKTTVKDLLGFVLSQFAKTVFSPNSYNNEIGVPITIFQCDKTTQYLVLEMGANKIGDLDYLTNIAPPDIACLLSVAPAHLQDFGSITNIIKAKTEIFANLLSNGTGIIPADNTNIQIALYKYNDKKFITFPKVPDLKNTKTALKTKLLGEHNLINMSAVLKICQTLQLDLDKVISIISKFQQLSPHRLQKIIKSNLVFLDDSYNANPNSMLAALQTLVSLQAKRYWAVLGKMEELGNQSNNLHKQIGLAFNNSLVSQVLIFGEINLYGSYNKFLYFSNKIDIIQYIKNNAKKGDNILVKASNYSKLWEVIEGV